MLNQAILVGRVKELHEGEITIAVSKAYKNAEGEYDTDIIKIVLEGNLNSSVNDYCSIGDIVGVKGRIESLSNDGLVIKAEKISFLSSAKASKITEDEDEQVD